MEVDFSKLDLATATKVDEVLRRDYNAKLLRAAERQRRIAFLNHLHRPLAKDGFGGRSVMIDPVFDAYWRECYGKDYTQDPDLVKFLVRRNPEIAVQTRGTKEIMVGWMPGPASKKPIGLKAAGLVTLFLLLGLLALPARALDTYPSSAFIGQTFQPAADAPSARAALDLVNGLLSDTNFLSGLATDTNFINVLAANQQLITSLANNPTFIVNFSTNPAAASNLVLSVPEKWHGLLTQSQTNHVFDDVRQHDVFSVASGVTLTLAADSTNVVQPTWGFANQGGYTSYRLAGSAVVVQPTHFVFLTPVPATATNGTVSCSQFGNSVLFAFCPTNGP